MSSFWTWKAGGPDKTRKLMLLVGVKTVCHTKPSQTHSQSLSWMSALLNCPSSPPPASQKERDPLGPLSVAECRGLGTGMEVVPGQERRCSGVLPACGCAPPDDCR